MRIFDFDFWPNKSAIFSFEAYNDFACSDSIVLQRFGPSFYHQSYPLYSFSQLPQLTQHDPAVKKDSRHYNYETIFQPNLLLLTRKMYKWSLNSGFGPCKGKFLNLEQVASVIHVLANKVALQISLKRFQLSHQFNWPKNVRKYSATS